MLFQSSLALHVSAAPETRVHVYKQPFFDESQDNVRSVTVFKKRMKQRRLATGSSTKPILKVRRIARRRNIDPERKKEREGLLRSISRTDFSLQTSSISGKSKGIEILRGRSIPFGCNMSISCLYSRARERYILCECSCKSSAIYNVICISPPPPPPPHVSSVRYAIWPMACW